MSLLGAQNFPYYSLTLAALAVPAKFSHLPDVGCTPEGQRNVHSVEAVLRTINGSWYAEEWLSADESLSFDDPYRMVTSNARLLCGTNQASHRQHDEGRRQQAIFTPHELLKWVTAAYEQKLHHTPIITSPVGMNQITFGANTPFALLVYGDIRLARQWIEKQIEIFTEHDVKSDPSVSESLASRFQNV